ncbi:glucose-1-phosphate adenylyltransferase subunit GlgD [Streptococcus sp. CSL10205-OR2]|uniref:glucose-1-phosphate adenylyltransferase subunit GlgD n=1 Tax=Streptococcus sp. CSL10205-OR2 TaxID=2980558 RepID=UPI0021DA4285|nr:glucose-1-phosphate adenylyltransferase subunit GlgD [Streptococcus sp. CSL10205-OR2]MCU9533894.1 glucose-1-phosphate adenylyltransferase subunit GlgD [Streptococcus sp. CSL10205-OR2]
MKIDKYSAILGNAVGYHDMAELTANRPLANLPFDGKYRLIDFQLSSLANAGIRSVYGIFRGQNIRSVFDHIRSGREWGLSTLLSHYFLGFYNTQSTDEYTDEDYYNQILTYLKRSGSDQTIYMTCDILCNINLEQVIHLHNVNKRQITVVYKKLPQKMVSPVNDILEIDELDNVIGKKEKADSELVSMSADIYVVNTPWLIEKMEEELKTGKLRKIRYLLRDLIVTEKALAFEYTGYLSNINSVKSYFEANMDMLDSQKFYSLLYSNQKVYTKIKNEEATFFDKKSTVLNSQFASGSIIKGHVEHSIISRNCYIKEDAKITNAIIFPKVTIEEGAVVEYAIIDKGNTIPKGVTIKGTKEEPLVIAKGQKVDGDIIK